VSVPVDPPARPRPLDPLRVRQFRWFWIAAFISNTGGWMQNATIPYVVYQLTGRAGEVGITGFFQYVPFMVMGLVGGYVSDRFARRESRPEDVARIAELEAEVLREREIVRQVQVPVRPDGRTGP
jgi:hypothetical protein